MFDLFRFSIALQERGASITFELVWWITLPAVVLAVAFIAFVLGAIASAAEKS